MYITSLEFNVVHNDSNDLPDARLKNLNEMLQHFQAAQHLCLWNPAFTVLSGTVKYSKNWLHYTRVLLTVNMLKRSPRQHQCWIAAIGVGVLKRQLLTLLGPPWLNVLTAAFCCWENNEALTATQLQLLAWRGADIAVTWRGNTETLTGSQVPSCGK